MRRVLQVVLAVVSASAAASTANAQIGVGDNDRVVFYGDKLVRVFAPGFAQGYSFVVESFVRVKYPESKARYWHVGMSGYDTIEVANGRFDSLVAPLKPTVIVLNWGLGDGRMKRFSAARMETVTQEFTKLVERCQQLGAKVYIMTPPRPDVSKKNLLGAIDYDETIGKVAGVMADVGRQKGVPVLDWYGACVAAAADADGQGKLIELAERDGLLPSSLSHALAANLIMEAWQFAPIDVTVQVDWSAQSASTTHGHVEVGRVRDEFMRLKLSGFPMPLYTGVGKASFKEDFAYSGFCRVLLKIDHLPEGSVLLAAEHSSRRRSKAVSAEAFRDGYNLAVDSPLARAKPLRELNTLIVKKNNACTQMIDAQRKLVDDDVEPELMTAYETNVLLRKQYNDGLAKILQRTGRTLDLALEIKLTPGR